MSEPTTTPAAGHEHGHEELSFLQKYIFSTDHKIIGIQFMFTGLIMLLLGGIVKLGHVALYRSISIAAGVGSIILVGLIARRTLRSQTMQLVCAAAFVAAAVRASAARRRKDMATGWRGLCKIPLPRTEGKSACGPLATRAPWRKYGPMKLNENESIWQNPALQYKLHYEEKIQFSIRIL